MIDKKKFYWDARIMLGMIVFQRTCKYGTFPFKGVLMI